MASFIRTAMLLILTALGCDPSSNGNDTATRDSATPQQADDDTTKQVEPSKQRELLPAGERFTTEEFSVLVPDGWNNDPQLAAGVKKLFIVGDGKGVPIFDDTRSPLQLGMEVEHYTADETIEDRIKILTEDARTAPQRTLASEPIIERIQLADGTKASLMFVEMIKQGFRRSLYMKLLVQDHAGTTWATTGWIVASKDSKLPRKDSRLANRMKSFIQSFALAEKREP